jgi:hypothetical protein
MKRLLLIAMTGLLVNMSTTWASGKTLSVEAYKCINKAGKARVGTGRLTEENEYSSYLKKPVRAGEYVIFKYDDKGKDYWFKSSNCTKIKS